MKRKYYALVGIASLVLLALVFYKKPVKENNEKNTRLQTKSIYETKISKNKKLKIIKNKYFKQEMKKYNIKEFHHLKEKAIRSTEEKKKMESYFSDQNLRKAYLKYISLVPTFDNAEERLDILNFIIYGLKTKNNMEALVQISKKIISSPIAGDDEVQRRFEVGDKMELVHLLNKSHPYVIEDLLAMSHGTKLEKIIRYTINKEI